MNKLIEKIVKRINNERGIAFLTLANTGKAEYDLAYEYVHSFLNKALDIIQEEAKAYNDCILVHTQGLDEGIYCAMCTNSIKSNKGCDGGCSVNKDMYEKVLDVIKNQTVDWLKAEREG